MHSFEPNGNNKQTIAVNMDIVTARYKLSYCYYFIIARQHHLCRARYMLSPVRLSDCLSHGTTGGSVKTVEIKIVQLTPQSSPVQSL